MKTRIVCLQGLMLVPHSDCLSFVGVCLHISVVASFCSLLYKFNILISVFCFWCQILNYFVFCF